MQDLMAFVFVTTNKSLVNAVKIAIITGSGDDSLSVTDIGGMLTGSSGCKL